MQKQARREALQELMQHLQQMDAEKLGAMPPSEEDEMGGEMGSVSDADLARFAPKPVPAPAPMAPEMPEEENRFAPPSGELPIGDEEPMSEEDEKQKKMDELFNKDGM